MSKYKKVILEAAREAGKIIMKNYNHLDQLYQCLFFLK